jgi:hypothetical protein
MKMIMKIYMNLLIKEEEFVFSRITLVIIPLNSSLKNICTTYTRENQRRYKVQLYAKAGTKELALIKGNGNIATFYLTITNTL